MSMSNVMENELLLLYFNNTNAAGVGDATGLRGSSTAGNCYLALHTADPGEGGTQTTSEATYTSYARVAVARSGAGWTVTANSASPAATVGFPAGTGGSGTVTHFSIGDDAAGGGKIRFSGTVSPNVVTGNGITPQLTTASTITLD